MDMTMLRDVIVMIALVALIGAAAGIALDDFQSDTTSDGFAYNITQNGLKGLLNASEYFDTIGTIAGVAVLIGLVVAAFYVVRR